MILIFIKKYTKGILLSLVLLYFYYLNCNAIEPFNIETDTDIDQRKMAYKSLMDDFKEIFPDNNRNAGGAQFFKHIVDLNLTKDNFELYNSFYCGVSGSPVDPAREDVYDYVIVKDIDGNDIYGKYYRCCYPCLCDIMKYARVDKYDITFNDTCVTYDVLTIDDPCCNPNYILENKSITSFKCSGNKTQNGVHSRSGRLIFALFYDTKLATSEDHDNIQSVIDNCKQRMNTEPNNLKGGMGNIFVNLSLVCNQSEDSNNDQTHPTLKNIYGEPLKPCKTGKSPGSWDSNGYCSEKGGGVHQICMHVSEDTQDFSNKTGQSNWSEDRIGNNHCMCLGAWALYKAKDEGNDNELVCESIPEMALNTDYVEKWNKWNGNELSHQIIKGVDSKVKQCYDKKNSPYLKIKYDNLRNHYNLNTNQKWNSIL